MMFGNVELFQVYFIYGKMMFWICEKLAHWICVTDIQNLTSLFFTLKQDIEMWFVNFELFEIYFIHVKMMF